MFFFLKKKILCCGFLSACRLNMSTKLFEFFKILEISIFFVIYKIYSGLTHEFTQLES